MLLSKIRKNWCRIYETIYYFFRVLIVIGKSVLYMGIYILVFILQGPYSYVWDYKDIWGHIWAQVVEGFIPSNFPDIWQHETSRVSKWGKINLNYGFLFNSKPSLEYFPILFVNLCHKYYSFGFSFGHLILIKVCTQTLFSKW